VALAGPAAALQPVGAGAGAGAATGGGFDSTGGGGGGASTGVASRWSGRFLDRLRTGGAGRGSGWFRLRLGLCGWRRFRRGFDAAWQAWHLRPDHHVLEGIARTHAGVGRRGSPHAALSCQWSGDTAASRRSLAREFGDLASPAGQEVLAADRHFLGRRGAANSAPVKVYV
jgi:hypothetical protein